MKKIYLLLLLFFVPFIATATPTGFNIIPESSSETALDDTEIFTGTWVEVDRLGTDVVTATKTDQSGLLKMEFAASCPNGVATAQSSLSFNVAANSNEVHRLTLTRKCYRTTFTNNSGSNQTSFSLQTSVGNFNPLNKPFNSSIFLDDDSIVVRFQDQDEILKGKIEGQYIVSKFARNPDVDAAEDIWSGGGTYTGFPTTAAETFEIASSSANDTAAGTGARTVRIFYYDENYNMFDANGDFFFVDVTLNGTSYVDTGIDGMRVWRARVLTSGSGKTNAGDLTIRWDVTTSAIFAVVPAGISQTETSNFTIPEGYTGYLKRYASSMNDGGSQRVNMVIKVQDFGSNTERLTRPFVVSSNANFSQSLYGGSKFEEKTDIIFRATATSSANAIVTVDYALLLVKN